LAAAEEESKQTQTHNIDMNMNTWSAYDAHYERREGVYNTTSTDVAPQELSQSTESKAKSKSKLKLKFESETQINENELAMEQAASTSVGTNSNIGNGSSSMTNVYILSPVVSSITSSLSLSVSSCGLSPSQAYHYGAQPPNWVCPSCLGICTCAQCERKKDKVKSAVGLYKQSKEEHEHEYEYETEGQNENGMGEEGSTDYNTYEENVAQIIHSLLKQYQIILEQIKSEMSINTLDMNCDNE